MKIWLDDLHQPSGTSWTWLKTYEEAIDALKNERVEEISFDNDLGTEKEGYDVAKWIEEMAADTAIDRMIWHIHSANPIGRKNITAAMKKADSFWYYQEDAEEEDEEEIPEKGEWQ